MIFQNLGARIRTCRLQKNLTQAELAKLMGMCPSMIGHAERGSREISVKTLVALCNALDVSPAYLLKDSLKTHDKHLSEWLPDDDKGKLVELLRLSLEIVEKEASV